MLPVAGYFIQVALCHKRRERELVAVLLFHVLDKTLQDLAELGALGHQKRQSLAHLGHGGEVLKLASHAVMVAFLTFLQELQVCLEFFLVEERGAVDSLELVVIRVPPPVSAACAKELERGHPSGIGQVRPPAQVNEVSLAVDRYLLALRSKFIDKLYLVRFVPEQLFRFVDRKVLAGDGHFLLDDAAHLVLYLLQGILVHRVHQEVVIESLLDGRPDTELRAGAQALHGLRQHMRGAVAENIEGLAVTGRVELHGSVGGNGRGKITQLAIHLNGHGAFGQPGAYGLRHLKPGHGPVELLCRPIGQRNGNHIFKAPWEQIKT